MQKSVDCSFSINGNGPPLFLVHGIGATRDAWRFIIPSLKNNFTVVSYDLRGHGKSPKTKNKFNLDDLVEDLESLRNKLNFPKIYIAGHSLGGMIAPAYTLKYQKNVFAISLLSTAAGRSENEKLKILNVIKLMEQEGISKIVNTLVNRWFTDDFIKKYPEIIEKRIQQLIDTDPEVFLNVFRIYANTEMIPWLHKIYIPSLVLTGERDGGCNPQINKLIADELPNSKLVILPNFKHSLLLEAPIEVGENLIEFFGGH